MQSRKSRISLYGRKHREGFLRCLDGIFLVLLGAYVFLGMTRVPFHGDESTLIRLSMDFQYLFMDRDYQKVLFHSSNGYWPEAQYERVLTGAVDPLTIGLAWSAAGIDRSEINGYWIWFPTTSTDEWTYNAMLRNLPGDRLLAIARTPSTLFTALSIVVIFAIALGLTGSRPAAWIAALLYAASPGILVNGRRAMQEGAMLLGTSLVVLCAVYLVRWFREESPREGRIGVAYGLLGLASGFALASKHSAALIIAPIYASIFILLWFTGGGWKQPQEKTALHLRLFWGWLGSGLLGLSFFYILMPVWWSFGFHWLILLCASVICFLLMISRMGKRIWIFQLIPTAVLIAVTIMKPVSWMGIETPALIILQTRADITAIHRTLGLELPTAASRFGEMAYQLLSAKTQYYESLDWDYLEQEQAQIRIYEGAHLDGRGGGTVWGIVVLGLAAVGAAFVLFRMQGWDRLLWSLWFILPAILLLITNPLAWQRYYLLLIAPWSVLAGFAAVSWAAFDGRGSIRKILAKKTQ